MATGDFLTIAELALVILGFAALVASVRGPDESRDFATRFILEIALTALALSLVPVLLSSFGISGALLWALCSAVGAIVVPGHVLYSSGRIRRGRGIFTFLSRMGPAAAAIALGLGVLNLANASTLLWTPSPGPFVASVLHQLGSACLVFVAALRQGSPSS